jgi:hypothetical protein|tara:strand:- start:1039 stop:1227 length:189 start_codon:yes stop_codon:yes gene_type:complete
MDDFNVPGSNKSQMDDESRKFAFQIQLDNICRILDGKVSHFTCNSKTTTYNKIVIEYNQENK